MPRFLSLALPLGSLLLGALGGCRHDQPLPNPCQAAKANPLAFHYEEFTGAPTADTASTNQLLTFIGPGAPYTTYRWQVGPVTTRSTQQFALLFDDTILGDIPVTLIAHRPPNTACFPHDDGIDTLTQTLTLVPRPNLRAPIYGKFQGANRSTPRDTFTVQIYSGPNYAHLRCRGPYPPIMCATCPKAARGPTCTPASAGAAPA